MIQPQATISRGMLHERRSAEFARLGADAARLRPAAHAVTGGVWDNVAKVTSPASTTPLPGTVLFYFGQGYDGDDALTLHT